MIFSEEPAHHLRDGLFPTIEQQQDTIRFYHEHQSIDYAALQEALDSSKWQEAIAVEFDTSDDPSARFTHRHRLTWDTWETWDIFSPFYNCPSQQLVGTPRKLFDGGKWMCGVQQLLQCESYYRLLGSLYLCR